MSARLATPAEARHLFALHDHEAAATLRLWLVVIGRTLIDATAPDEEMTTRSGRRDREEARAALTEGHHAWDRRLVSELAGLDPGFLCRFGAKLAAGGWHLPAETRVALQGALGAGRRGGAPR